MREGIMGRSCVHLFPWGGISIVITWWCVTMVRCIESWDTISGIWSSMGSQVSYRPRRWIWNACRKHGNIAVTKLMNFRSPNTALYFCWKLTPLTTRRHRNLSIWIRHRQYVMSELIHRARRPASSPISPLFVYKASLNRCCWRRRMILK